jgi:hypothetical protein
MANIDNPQAVKFCNEKMRTTARAKLALAITEGYRDWAHKFLGVALMNYTEVAVQEIKNASSDAFQTAFEPFVTAMAVAKFGGQ